MDLVKTLNKRTAGTLLVLVGYSKRLMICFIHEITCCSFWVTLTKITKTYVLLTKLQLQLKSHKIKIDTNFVKIERCFLLKNFGDYKDSDNFVQRIVKNITGWRGLCSLMQCWTPLYMFTNQKGKPMMTDFCIFIKVIKYRNWYLHRYWYLIKDVILN